MIWMMSLAWIGCGLIAGRMMRYRDDNAGTYAFCLALGPVALLVAVLEWARP